MREELFFIREAEQECESLYGPHKLLGVVWGSVSVGVAQDFRYPLRKSRRMCK